MNLLEYHLGKGVRAFSTLRNSGGVGEGAYASFNITPYCGDSLENVAASRVELAEELGIIDERIILPTQKHTNTVKVLDDAYWTMSLQQRVSYLQDVDALVTKCRGVCIGVSTADCVPVLLFDEKRHIIGVAHAGWRGVLGHIVQNVVQKMKDLGSDAKDIKTIIAPSIGPASFEVGEEVVEAFVEAGFPENIVLRHYTKPHIDLWASVAWELENAGVLLQNIQIAGVDTYTHSDSFFSARHLGILSGRIFSGILLE